MASPWARQVQAPAKMRAAAWLLGTAFAEVAVSHAVSQILEPGRTPVRSSDACSKVVATVSSFYLTKHTYETVWCLQNFTDAEQRFPFLTAAAGHG
jgi:hypothetical protein